MPAWRATLWAGMTVAVLCLLQWSQGQGPAVPHAQRAAAALGKASSVQPHEARAPADAVSAGAAQAPGLQHRPQAVAPRETAAKAPARSAATAGGRGESAVESGREQLSTLDRARLPLTAQVSFTGVRTAGPLMPAVVSRMLSRAGPMVRECYVEAASRTGSDVPASVPMWFSIDESGAVRDGTLGAQARPALAACVLAALRRMRSDQAPEAGIVSVAAELKFQATL